MAMLVALVSLFAVGCGDSGEDFVVTGNQGNQGGGNTGAVTFQFARAQTVTVPQATALIDIDFFNAQGQVVLAVNDLAFNTTITVPNVPTSAVTARITAKNAAGVPLATQDYNLNVVAGGTSSANPQGAVAPVTLTTLDTTPATASVAVGATAATSSTATFSDGTTLPAGSIGGTLTFTSANAAVATVNASGVITGVTAGNTTVTSNLVFGGVTRTDSVAVTVTAVAPPSGTLVANPTTVNLTNASPTQAITTTINGAPVTATGTFGNTTLGLSFAGGNVTSSTIINGTTTLTLTSGNTSTNVTVNVNRLAPGQTPTPPAPPGTPATLTIAQTTLFVNAAGGTTPALSATFTPANSTVSVPVPVGQLVGVAQNPNPAGTENRWTFNTAASTITANGTGGQPAENNTIQFNVTHTPVSGPGASAVVSVTAVNAADPRLTAVVSSQLLGPTSLTLPSGSRYPFVVINTLGNGTRAIAAPGTGTVGQVSIDPTSSTNVGTYDTGTNNRLTGAAVPATGNVVLRRLTALPGTFTNVATVNVSVVNTTLLGGGAANVVLTPSANSIRGGSPLPYKVEWLLQNGSRLDVTSFYNYNVTGAFTAFAADPVSGLASGIAPSNPVAVLTASTIAVNAILGGELTVPPGVAPVNSPAAAVNHTP